MQQSRAGVSSPGLRVGPCAAHQSKSILMDGGKWDQPSPSFPQRRVRGCCCLGNPHRRTNNHPSFVPCVPQIPVFILSVSEPAAIFPSKNTQCACVLTQAHQLSFKTPNFRDMAYMDPCLSSRRGLAALGLSVCPKRAVVPKT